MKSFLIVLLVLPFSLNAQDTLYNSDNLTLPSQESAYNFYAYRPNYFLPLKYNSSTNSQHFNQLQTKPYTLNNIEVKLQLSLMVPIIENFIGDSSSLNIAYSQVAFWQAYNTKESSPFKEINFEPEIFISKLNNKNNLS